MRNSKIVILAATAVTAIVGIGAASAADLAARPYTKAAPMMVAPGVDWSGFYVGVNGGYAWTDHTTLGHLDDNPLGIRPTGGFGGGQLGYNYQVSNVVLGIEADIQASDIRASILDLNFGDTFSSKLDWFGTVRGRIGYAFNPIPLLAYVTGGFAYGHVVSNAFGPNLEGTPFHFDGIRTGYAVGGGFEYKFAPAWSVKAEYQYINFDTINPTNAAGFAYVSSVFNSRRFVNSESFNTVRIGINYAFGGPVIAKY